MKRTLIAIAMALALVLIPVGSALADTTDTVTVNATPGWVSITNAPTVYDFLVVLAGVDKFSGEDYFTITNDSTVAMDVSIEADDWAAVPPGTNTWTYGAAGADTAQLLASDGDGAYDVTVPGDPAPAVQLMDAIGVGVDPTWELGLDAPSSFTFVDEQEITVTLTAVPD
jgi:hypothetical protein